MSAMLVLPIASTHCTIRSAGCSQPVRLQRTASSRTLLRRSCTPFSTHRLSAAKQRSQLLTCAQSNGGPSPPPPTEVESKPDSKTEKLMAGMKKSGLDQATAKRVLKVWADTGAVDPQSLKKMLLGRSLKSVGVVLVQVLLDAGAAWGGFGIAQTIGQADSFPLQLGVQAIAYFIGSYFAVGVVFDLFTLGVLTSASIQYQANTEAYMAAVQSIAGQQSGLDVVDKAATAVNVLKVSQALNAISQILKENSKNGNTATTLEDLSAYLVISRAQEKYGFEAQRYGLSDDEAGNIAVIFARYDANDDYRLELSELRKLSQDCLQHLEEDELKAAIKLLDLDSSGYIEFPEFVNWWVNEIKPELPVEAAK